MASDDVIGGSGKTRDEDGEQVPDRAVAARFSPEEEKDLLDQSNAQKAEANKFFSASEYSQAIGEYDKALSLCPNYLEYEVAVLKSNIAACHVKLADWKAAIDAATQSLEALDRLKPAAQGQPDDANKDEPVELADDEEEEQTLAKLQASDQRREEIQRIRMKALLRRAKARSEQGGWGSLQGAEEDYKDLTKFPNLPASEQRLVKQALVSLQPRINAAKEQEMGEMMGKLKELGNGILKPFGFSTDNFKFNKDPATGGYNMNFEQNP